METLGTVIILALLQYHTVLCLECYVGLDRGGKNPHPVVECPEERRYVCVEMIFGGMGERIIKRYCEKMEPEAYEDILDIEARVSEGLEESDQDLNCEQTMDRGRQVTICRCSTDKCNKGMKNSASAVDMMVTMTMLFSLAVSFTF